MIKFDEIAINIKNILEIIGGLSVFSYLLLSKKEKIELNIKLVNDDYENFKKLDNYLNIMSKITNYSIVERIKLIDITANDKKSRIMKYICELTKFKVI